MMLQRAAGGRLSRVSRRRWLLGAGSSGVAVSLGWSPPLCAKGDSLSARLQVFSTSVGLEAQFVETKHIALLRDPLINRGRIYFCKPHHFARIIEAPVRSSMVLDGDQLTLARPSGETQTWSLGSRPELLAVSEGIIAVLAGDAARLRRTFEVELREGVNTPARGATKPAGESGWVLRLLPRAPAARRLIQELQFAGNNTTLSRLVVREAQGDRSEMSFAALDRNRRFSAEEMEALFGVHERRG
jgi:outer membrane lipoprotein-sorting protein